MTPEQRGFIAAFRVHGNVTRAVREAGLHSRDTVYGWLKRDEAFKAAFAAAREEAADNLEDVAHQLATGRFRKYQFSKDGDPLHHPDLCDCGHARLEHTEKRHCTQDGCDCKRFSPTPYYEQVYDGGMIKFLHKILRPEAHREQIDIRTLGIDLDALPDEALERIANGEDWAAVVSELLRKLRTEAVA